MAPQINWKMSFEILHPVSSGLYPDNGLQCKMFVYQFAAFTLALHYTVPLLTQPINYVLFIFALLYPPPNQVGGGPG